MEDLEKDLKEQIFGKSGGMRDDFGIKLPPNSALELQSKIIEYVPKKSIAVQFPVQEKHTGPLGILQGGILTAFFDDTFGPLSFAVLKKPMVSIDIHVYFLRSVKVGDTVTIRAEVTSRGRKVIFMKAEAYDQKNKLIATATSSALIFKEE
ncbi:MAG TPA: PaaI family thioesterase [Leptospiraceae bacterium]|nr:PaaI family thioesterase [Leptospiraceae bacterium]HMW05644.1 PaaI family thioesterase [Leptospiraceae bacterium]HMX34742.1 PaaI family thioesterase [Leptospiraceae bacterium]HMY30323.1 PaaI family thioesterase [Leptospiraceae bacterium]HMZ63676.1 PaaI family thioesterase [Leptospiraceae bacterium]